MWDHDTTRSDIPVYLYVPDGGTFLGLPIPVVEQEIRMALDEWDESSTAKLAPRYAGLTSDPSSKRRIVVRATSDSDDCPANASACQKDDHGWWPAYPFGEYREGSTIWFIHKDGSPAWSQQYFSIVFTHEVGHSFGL